MNIKKKRYSFSSDKEKTYKIKDDTLNSIIIFNEFIRIDIVENLPEY